MANEVNIRITGEDEVSGMIGGVTGALGVLGDVAAGVALAGIAALTAGLVALADVMKTSVDDAMNLQDAEVQLAQVIKTTGDASQVTTDQANKFAEAMATQTRFSKEATLSAEALMMQFTSLKGQAFDQSMMLAMDLATRRHMDLSAAAQLLGRTLQDPITGFGMLTRVIGQVDPELKKHVETLAKAGDIAQADAIIMQYLQDRIGGAAEAAGTDFAGQLDIMNNKFQDIREQLGLKIIPLFQDFISRVITPLIPLISDLALKFGDFFVQLEHSKFFNDFLNNAEINLLHLTEALSNLMSGNFKLPDIFQNIMGNVSNSAASVDWSGLGRQIAQSIGQAIGAVGNFLANIDWGGIWKTAQGLFAAALQTAGGFAAAIDWGQISKDLIAGLKSIDWFTIGATIRQDLINFDALTTSLVNGFMSMDWGSIANAFFTGLSQAISGLLGPNPLKTLLGPDIYNLWVALAPGGPQSMTTIMSQDAMNDPLAGLHMPQYTTQGAPGSQVHSEAASPIVVNLHYTPLITTNTSADVEHIMPIIAEGVKRELKNLGVSRVN